MGSEKTEECALHVRHDGVFSQTSRDRRVLSVFFCDFNFLYFTSRSWSLDDVSLKARMQIEEDHLMNA